MHSASLKVSKNLDQEWIELIKEAKDAGLTVKDVRRFFINAKYIEEGDFSEYKATK
ncbi:anti-repressor SinI family protein [Virgibacillus oceani]